MQNLSRCLEFHARVRPRANALIYQGECLDYETVYRRCLRVADWLASRGVSAGDVVALLLKNSPAFLEITYALSYLGAVSLPLNYRLSADEVAYITQHAGACLLIADEEFGDVYAGLAIETVALDAARQANASSLASQQLPRAAVHPCANDDLFRLMYTSGTTARPKGVMHSYGNWYWKSIDHVIALGLTSSDRLCVVGPLYHVGGFDLPGSAVWWVGGTIVLEREFEPHSVMSSIAREQVTGIWLAPVMTNAILNMEQLHQFDASSLRWCIGGGERTPESRIRRFVEVFPNARYIDGYGMTETVSGDTLMEAGYELEKIGSTGRVLLHGELEIRDDEGNPLPGGVAGEICMRGEKVTKGYWRDPQRTQEAFWPDGWLRSGDVGYLDHDGFLFLTDRKKDLIISGGENIASSEVERVIYEMPQVLEAAVIGRPDEKWGERPVAVVVAREGLSVDLPTLQAHCRKMLAAFKVPSELVLVEALPRNPSGKVLKRTLREQLR